MNTNRSTYHFSTRIHEFPSKCIQKKKFCLRKTLIFRLGSSSLIVDYIKSSKPEGRFSALPARAREYNNSPTRREPVIKLHAAILDRDAFASGNELRNDTSWSAIIWNRLTRVLRTHAFRIDIDRMLNADSTGGNSSQPETNDNAVQGEISMFARWTRLRFDPEIDIPGRRRHRHRHRHHMPHLMMMGLLLMGSILVPMGFQFLAVLGGKALILAKMALILSSIQGLKKVATSGINYGLYHADGWHDRSQVFPEDEEHHQIYRMPHP